MLWSRPSSTPTRRHRPLHLAHGACIRESDKTAPPRVRLPGLRLSAGLMAHQTTLPGLVCSPGLLAQASPNIDIHTRHLSLTGLSTWDQARSIVPTPSKTVDHWSQHHLRLWYGEGQRLYFMSWMWTCLVAPVGLAGWIKKIIVLTSFCVLEYTRDISWISQLSHDIPVLWDVPGISLIVAVYTMDIPNTCSKCLNLTWN